MSHLSSQVRPPKKFNTPLTNEQRIKLSDDFIKFMTKRNTDRRKFIAIIVSFVLFIAILSKVMLIVN